MSKFAAEGREILERRFKNWKIDMDEGRISKMATKLGYKAVSDMFQSLAQGKEDVLRLRETYTQLDEQPAVIHTEKSEYVPKEDLSALAIEVDMNVKNVDYNLATCCSPKPGDPIFAFVSVTKGIRIHCCNCTNAENMRQRYPYRILPARWAKK